LKTAIVILNWNGKDHLKKYLPFVFQHTSQELHEIIVADNGSTDGSIQMLHSEFPNCRTIELDQNYGFAGGYNKALAFVDAEIFCLLNSDVRVSARWIEPVLELFGSDKNIAAIQPKILSDRDWSRFEHAGAAGGFVDRFGYPFCRGRIMNVIEYDRGQYNYPTDIFWASGACLFIRSELFRKAAGFDSDFFAHMEEIDLCWKLKNQGYRITYCPQSKVFHWGGATLDYNNPRKLFLNFRNSLWTLYKNYTGKNLFGIMFVRMLIDSFAIVKFAVSFEFKNVSAIFSAHISFHRSKKQLKIKRKALQSNIQIRKHPEMLFNSIVWEFFIHSKRTFSKLKKFKKNLTKLSMINHSQAC
jgi:GT2 family glycosyltransferase